MTRNGNEGPLVIELGGRPGVATCGSLLSELGVTVVLVEQAGIAHRADSKMCHRASIAAGKKSLGVDLSCDTDRALLQRLIASSDAVLISSDFDGSWPDEIARAIERAPVVCDITACGATGPFAGQAYSDNLMQALVGLADTTGDPAGPPILCRAPILEFAAGTYAAAGVLIALRAWRCEGIQQKLEIALYDVAVSTLTTFLPTHFVGGRPQRVGNRHPGIAPWNAYRTTDGWVLICTSSDDQWARICELMGKPELATKSEFINPSERVRNVDALDGQIENWTKLETTQNCIRLLNRENISCGPVYSLEDLFVDANVVHRKAVVIVSNPDSNSDVRVPGRLFWGMQNSRSMDTPIPKRDEDRKFIAGLCDGTRRQVAGRTSVETGVGPLAGLKVLELGQYTTAPLAARQLGALGADVIKIESAGGDPARAMAPQQNGQSYFFTMGNSDKRSIVIDLRNEEGKARFSQLLGKADVLIENMRPGALAKLGFSREEIARINPRAIYCSISGFGHDAAYTGRPAMDTTIQGMSGLMDMTRGGDVPYKIGISIADIAGGQFALLGILAALDAREQGAAGSYIDLSMQDISAWYTRFSWNEGDTGAELGTIVRCTNGYLAVDQGVTLEVAEIQLCRSHLRDVAVEALRARGKMCVPVMSVGEVAEHPHTRARGLLVKGRSASNVEWPLVASPILLSVTKAFVRRAISGIGGDEAEVLRDWAMGSSAGRS